MLKLYNTLGRKLEIFRPVRKDLVTMFTCGPSVYQKAHIGNFRTFLFEDVVQRYLEYCGFNVARGMNFTDVEDKSLEEADKKRSNLWDLTGRNIEAFLKEMKVLRMKMPDYLPRASECVEEAADLITVLLKKGVAYRYKSDIYFDPLKFPGFGKLYGLDMSKWPSGKKRFSRDTYPGMRWNLGDFILWHGYREGDHYFWDTKIGKGRPAWNIQDASMISSRYSETLSIYCGGIDNLIRHHDYTIAVLESVRSYEMSRFWLHAHHLYVDGKKMSKSRGNIIYVEDLMRQGFAAEEVRFFLISGHYRRRLHYTAERMHEAASRIRSLRTIVGKISEVAANSSPAAAKGEKTGEDFGKIFSTNMDDDVRVGKAIDALYQRMKKVDLEGLNPDDAGAMVTHLRKIDHVLQVLF